MDKHYLVEDPWSPTKAAQQRAQSKTLRDITRHEPVEMLLPDGGA